MTNNFKNDANCILWRLLIKETNTRLFRPLNLIYGAKFPLIRLGLATNHLSWKRLAPGFGRLVKVQTEVYKESLDDFNGFNRKS